MEPAILVALIGIGGTLSAQIISNIFTNIRENKRREFDQNQKRMELENNRQEQRREERIQAYRNLAKITVTINPSEPYKVGDLAEAYSEIDLVGGSNEVKEAAQQLYTAALEARKKAREATSAGKDPTKDQDTSAAIKAAMERRAAFIGLASEELERVMDWDR